MMSKEILQEKFSVIAAIVSGMMVIANLYAGKTARDAFFLSYFDVADLPAMMIATAVLSAVAVLGFSRILTRHGPAVIIPPLYLLSGGLYVIQWWLLPAMPQLITVFLYLQASILTALLISGFWSIINERWDPHTGKQVMGKLVALNTIGGLLGAAAANAINQTLGPREILLFLGLLNAGCGIGLSLVIRGHRAAMSQITEEPKSGGMLGVLKRSASIRRMALMILIFSSMIALLDFLFKAKLQEEVSPEQLVTFFSYFYMVIGICSTLLQSTLGNKALTWLGVGGSMAILPFSLIGGSLLAFASTTLVTTTLLRGSAALLTQSFFRAGFEPLFTPMPKQEKRASKTLIDLGADRAGDLVGSGIIILVLLLPGQSDNYLLSLVIALCMLMLILVFMLQRDYVAQLASNLVAGSAEESESADRVSSGTLERTRLLNEIEAYREGQSISPDRLGAGVLAPGPARDTFSGDELPAIRDLTSGDSERIKQTLKQRNLTPALLPYVIPLLANGEVLAEAMKAMEPLARSTSGQLVDVLLDTQVSPLVRRRIPLLLARSGSRLAALGLLLGLEDQAIDVRYRCAQALAYLNEANAHISVDDQVLTSNIYAEIRRLGEENYREQQGVKPLRHLFHLLAVRLGPEVMNVCYEALSSDDQNVRGTAMEYLENQLPTDIHQAIAPLIASGERTASGRDSEQLLSELVSASEGSSGAGTEEGDL
jgi:ATP:ADP antiporter, AAA family